MKRWYIAHPYNMQEENKQSVEQIIKQIVKDNPDVLPVSPIHATGFLYAEMEYMDGMELCFELLSMCDELILCPGWEDSRGCKLEKEWAEKHGIPIEYWGD